jgi:uncharacterized membrane protein
MQRKIIGTIIAGIISIVIGVTTTYIVGQFIPTADLMWALIAVTFASFFSGIGGYASGFNHTQET